MKTLLSLLFILVIGVYAGCTPGSTGSDDDGIGNGPLTGGSGNAEEFFPFTGERSWTYEETRTESGQSPVTSEVTLSTNGTQTLEGQSYSVIHDPVTYADKYLRIENNIIHGFQYATQDYPWLNFNADAGDSWKVYEFTDSEISATSHGKYLGAEDVTVPAGTYRGCMKYEVSEDLNFHYNDGYTGTSSTTETYWLCKDVGPVKIQETIALDDTYSLTSTKVLKSFNDGSGSGGTLIGSWIDQSQQVKYVFSDDNLKYYIRSASDSEWTQSVDYKSLGFTIVNEDNTRLTITYGENYYVYRLSDSNTVEMSTNNTPFYNLFLTKLD